MGSTSRNTFSTVTLMAMILSSVPRSALAAAKVGQPAPALVVEELNGQNFNLAALRGKVVVINFWATWCQPCRREMPALDAFYRQYHGQGLEMIGLSADRPHERSGVGKVMQSFSYPAAMLDDVKADDFGDPNELPVTFIIDGKRRGTGEVYTRSNAGYGEKSVGGDTSSAARQASSPNVPASEFNCEPLMLCEQITDSII